MNNRQKFFASAYKVDATSPVIDEKYLVSPVNQEEFHTLFPINEVTNHPQDITSQLNSETNPSRQQMLLQLLGKVSNDIVDTKGLTDDEIISMIKSRSSDTPTENARYMEMLSGIVEDGIKKNEPTPTPSPAPDDNNIDPAIDNV